MGVIWFTRVLTKKEKNYAFFMSSEIKCSCGSGYTVSPLIVQRGTRGGKALEKFTKFSLELA